MILRRALGACSGLVLLASQSARRKELLRKMGVRFRVVRSSYKERTIRGLAPSKLAVRHAVGKAKKASFRRGGQLVLAADTIVWRRGRVFGKPKSRRGAVRMLTELSGRRHEVYTGIAILDPAGKKIRTGYARTHVLLKKLSREEISNYHKKVNPLDKAGAYAIQEGPRIVKKIVGSYTNVIGLPVELVKKMLAA